MATETITVSPPTSSIELDTFANTDERHDGITASGRPSYENDATTPATPETKPFKPTRRLWLVLMSISAISLCGAIEGTIVMNALPTIAAALGGGNLYLWVPNAFFLGSISVLPFYAQVSDIFGRRKMLLAALSLYVLGCALCGASNSMAMLVTARAIQGVGSGGIDTLCETIVLDLVPLRERGKYMSITSVGTIIGFALGPFMGGLIVEKAGWPWIFYLGAMLGGVALVMFFFFLRVKQQHRQTFWAKVKRIDFGGNAIFIGAVVAVMLALTWAGPVYRWNSVQILVPLTLGLGGLCAFIAFEWTPRLAPEPSFPRILVSNRTSSAALVMTIVNCITTVGTVYFLPVYFQGVLAKSPLESGIALAPTAATIVPFCLVCGLLLSKVGKYRPLHAFGWCTIIISVGLCSTLDRHSSTAAWAGFQLLGAAGIGSLTVSMLPAMQAPLSEREAATSAGMYIFARGFGSIWGVTIPAAIFNNVVHRLVKQNEPAFASNKSLAAQLAGGQAYQFATKAFLDSLPAADSTLRDQVITIFEHAIHVVFYALVAFAGLGMLLVLIEKEISMRKENNTEFGLEEDNEEGNRVGNSNSIERNSSDEMAAATVRSRYATSGTAKTATVNMTPVEEGHAGPSS